MRQLTVVPLKAIALERRTVYVLFQLESYALH